MNLYLRDDDTSFFTTKEELCSAFDGIWEYGPINLAVIPYSVFTENHGIKGEYFQDPTKEYFIGNNRELVSFLKRKISENKVSIMLHGYSHYYFPTTSLNYPFGIPEFLYLENQRDKILKAKNDLENLFNVEIKWFIPPSNSLSKETIVACDTLGLNVPLLLNLKDRFIDIIFDSPFSFFQNRLNKITKRNSPLKIGNHHEISCISYTSETDFCSSYVENTYNKVLATHYWELIRHTHIKEKVISDVRHYGGILNNMNNI